MLYRQPLHQMTRDLVAVAAGRRPASLVLRNVRWVNVHSGEILPGSMIAALGCRIAYCGPDRPELIGPATQALDAEGAYVVPGLLDAHVHIESSMLTVRAFADSALRHGMTGAFADPHEIANVLGLDGLRMMLEESRETPMQIYFQVPSCVPAAPGLETSGAALGPEDVAEAMTWDGVIGLGEVMNYPGVAMGDEGLHAEIAETLKARGVVGGHYASGNLGTAFHAYVAGGVSDCHEGTCGEDVLARIRQGMYAMLREGSAEKNAADQIGALLRSGVSTRHVLLCTDDRHPDTLLRRGHVDDVVRLAIHEGLSPVEAIRMATLNPAEHFGVAQDVGSIAPGRYADIVVVSDLECMTIEWVVAAGVVIDPAGPRKDVRVSAAPKRATCSVRLSRGVSERTFSIPVPLGERMALCRVIEIVEHQVLTRARVEEVSIEDGEVSLDESSGLVRLAVIDRHTSSGRVGRGLVRGYGILRPFGLASTVAHDCHNLIVMGSDCALMAEAADRVIDASGGLCLVRPDAEEIVLPLPVGGLMTTAPLHAVVDRLDQLGEALRELGCTVDDALMSFAFLALPVIPELRLTDLGLVDVGRFRIVPLVVDGDNPDR